MSASDRTPALSQALAGSALAKTSPTPAAAFAAAREIFRSGERIDMAKLADDLGVARTTLYRWTGDRDQLISDVLWAETKVTLDALVTKAAANGFPATREIGVGFMTVLAGSEPVRAFLRNEGQRALLLLTVPSSTYRTRLLEAVVEMIQRDVAHGYTPPETPELLADTIISLAERFLHNGGEPDANPSPEMAKRAIALLLRE
jgi:AcrR family transcriptional regulator